MVYNICWRSFFRGHDPVTITFWGFWLVIHLRWPEWRTRPESKGSCWNRNAVNSCTKNSDVTCPFHVFIVRTLFYFSDLCFLESNILGHYWNNYIKKLPIKKLQFWSVLYSCGVTVNFYCGSDLVLTSDAVFINKTVYWCVVTQLHSTTNK